METTKLRIENRITELRRKTVFDNIKHHVMIKAQNLVGTEESYINIVKVCMTDTLVKIL